MDHLACSRLFAFLMGLNDVYANARSQLLMASPLPSVGKAYAMIMADEGQRIAANSHEGGGVQEQMALHVGRGNSAGMQEQIAMFAGRNNQPRKPQPKKKNWDQTCSYCRLQGHVREECYRLNGYPSDWKFRKKPGGPANLMQ